MEWIAEHLTATVALALVGGFTLFEVAPIKINPWSWLLRKVGAAVNREVLERLKKLESKVDAIEAADGERDAVNARIRILRFGDEVLHGVEHSKEHFDQTLLDITKYNEYCKAHPAFQNEMTVLTAQQIKRAYMSRWEKHDFL